MRGIFRANGSILGGGVLFWCEMVKNTNYNLFLMMCSFFLFLHLVFLHLVYAPFLYVVFPPCFCTLFSRLVFLPCYLRTFFVAFALRFSSICPFAARLPHFSYMSFLRYFSFFVGVIKEKSDSLVSTWGFDLCYMLYLLLDFGYIKLFLLPIIRCVFLYDWAGAVRGGNRYERLDVLQYGSSSLLRGVKTHVLRAIKPKCFKEKQKRAKRQKTP